MPQEQQHHQEQDRQEFVAGTLAYGEEFEAKSSSKGATVNSLVHDPCLVSDVSNTLALVQGGGVSPATSVSGVQSWVTVASGQGSGAGDNESGLDHVSAGGLSQWSIERLREVSKVKMRY